MRVGSGWLFTMGVLVGIGFDAWFAQLLDITSILLTKVGPEVYKWVPSKDWFPPLAIQVLSWWVVVALILLGTHSLWRKLRRNKTPSHSN